MLRENKRCRFQCCACSFIEFPQGLRAKGGKRVKRRERGRVFFVTRCLMSISLSINPVRWVVESSGEFDFDFLTSKPITLIKYANVHVLTFVLHGCPLIFSYFQNFPFVFCDSCSCTLLVLARDEVKRNYSFLHLHS